MVGYVNQTAEVHSVIPAGTSVGWPIGTGTNGEVLFYDPMARAGVVVAGSTGSGKTVLLRGMVYSALIGRRRVTIVDVTKGGFGFNFARTFVDCLAVTHAAVAEALENIYLQMQLIQDLLAVHAVDSRSQLPEDVRPPLALLVIDELGSVVLDEPVHAWRTTDPQARAQVLEAEQRNLYRRRIRTHLALISRDAQRLGVTVLLGTQKVTANVVDAGLTGDAPKGFARIIMAIPMGRVPVLV